MPQSSETFVIVGGGQAGAWIARTLRGEGFAGRIVIIGEEEHWPYERPPLSKAFLVGTADETAMTLLSPAQSEEMQIECWRGQKVEEIDRSCRTVVTASGDQIGYNKLFLTTGGTARTFSWLEGMHSDRIHSLRTLADASRLRTAIRESRSLLVLGGGWIGLEVAATARAMGLAVIIVEAAPSLCSRTMPATVSDFLRRLHEANGVTVLMGTGVTGLTADDAGAAATLSDGTVLLADHALVGIGIAPNTALAVACGLAVDDGIVVDAQGRSSDPDIFAAGDVARQSSTFAGFPLRLESWANAQNQAISTAKAALGAEDRYTEIPWFWSDQYEINLQILGLPGAGVRTVVRGTPDAAAGCWLMLKADNTVAGAVAVNAPLDLRILRKMLAERRMPNPEAWEDPTVPVRRLPTLSMDAPATAI